LSHEPLLLAPGVASDGTVWRDMPPGQVVTSEAVSIEAMAADILARAPPRFALAGSSLGGYIALAMVRAAPERVTRLALLGSSALPDDPRQQAMRRKMIAAAERDFPALFALLQADMTHPDTPDSLRAELLDMALRVGAGAFIRHQHAAMERPDARPGLAAIAVPTLVLAGEDDKVIPPQRSMEMAAAIPGARLTLLSRCGHVPMRERPRETRGAMEAWLAEGS